MRQKMNKEERKSSYWLTKEEIEALHQDLQRIIDREAINNSERQALQTMREE